MCNNCFPMNRRTFTKAGVSASAAALLGGFPSGASANLTRFSVPGELTPSFEPSRWVKAINQSDLEPYRHEAITHIAYHHEGYADGNEDFFASRRLTRPENPIQRTYDIHNFHVEEGYGMIAYNYTVAPNGEIVKARPLDFAPATGSTDPKTREIANFSGHFAVVALADFDFEPVEGRQEQVLSMIKVMSLAQRTFKIPSTDIRPHKDHVAYNGEFGSTCPGRKLYSERTKIREMTLAMSIQSELAGRGCYAGEIDGLFGPVSASSLEQFANASGALKPLAFNDAALWAIVDSPDSICL